MAGLNDTARRPPLPHCLYAQSCELSVLARILTHIASAPHTTYAPAGKVGWVAKGIVYAIIGGLCCRSAADERSNVDTSPQVCLCSGTWVWSYAHRFVMTSKTLHCDANTCLAPVSRCGCHGKVVAVTFQGAFELLGSGKSGKILLIIEMAGMLPGHAPFRLPARLHARCKLRRLVGGCSSPHISNFDLKTLRYAISGDAQVWRYTVCGDSGRASPGRVHMRRTASSRTSSATA